MLADQTSGVRAAVRDSGLAVIEAGCAYDHGLRHSAASRASRGAPGAEINGRVSVTFKTISASASILIPISPIPASTPASRPSAGHSAASTAAASRMSETG